MVRLNLAISQYLQVVGLNLLDANGGWKDVLVLMRVDNITADKSCWCWMNSDIVKCLSSQFHNVFF